jgi:predicted nucleic acid-binding protein
MILIDLNVVLDVIQKRQPHYQASAQILDRVVKKEVVGVLAGHAVTTIHYLVSRYQTLKIANSTTDFLLNHFSVAAVGKDQLLRARSLNWPDFEDAVVESAAESHGCAQIVSRNVKDFKKSSLTVLTPEEYLARG